MGGIEDETILRGRGVASPGPILLSRATTVSFSSEIGSKALQTSYRPLCNSGIDATVVVQEGYCRQTVVPSC